jgi:hypothetical protein
MKKSLKHLALLLFVVAAPLALWAQFTVSGTVNGTGNKPLAGASVKLMNSFRKVFFRSPGKQWGH